MLGRKFPILLTKGVRKHVRECNCCLVALIDKYSLIILFVSAVEKARVHTETELSMVRFIHQKAPCRCLKALKSKLKETYGPQFDTCKNSQCQKAGGIDDFFQCSGCLRRYCSEACQKADWDNGKHGGWCKERSGKRALDRAIKMEVMFPGVPVEYFAQLGEEERNELHQMLDDSTKEEIAQIRETIIQNMNLDE